MRIYNMKIEPEAINTDKNRLICFKIIYWKKDIPIFKMDQCCEEPKRYHFEYEKDLEAKLIDAVRQSEILGVIVENQKIVKID